MPDFSKMMNWNAGSQYVSNVSIISSDGTRFFGSKFFGKEDIWLLNLWTIARCTACLKAGETTFLRMLLFGWLLALSPADFFSISPPPLWNGGMVSERSLLFAASFLLLGQCRTRVQRALVKSEAKTTRPHFATPFLRNVQLHAHLLNSGMAKHCHRPGAIPGTEIVPDSFFVQGNEYLGVRILF